MATPLDDISDSLHGIYGRSHQGYARPKKEPGHPGLEAVLVGQRKALELAVHGAPLESVLGVLVQTAETLARNDLVASILVVDGARLRHGAAPSLPDSYNRAVDGIAIGPGVGSCGTAAHAGKTVVVSDIASDPLWADFRDLALAHDLRACWSMPIFSGQGEVLGTFALYYRKSCDPTPQDHEVVELLSHTAALVIERHKEIRERMIAERALEAARDDLALQVAGLQRMHALAMRLATTQELAHKFQMILQTATDLHGNDRGILALYDPAANLLRAVASVGLDDAALALMGCIRPGPGCGACGTAFASRTRVLVEDTEVDPCFDAYRAAARAVGFRSVHSTPVLTRSGEILGVLSIHFDIPRRPSALETQLADMCARHAADAFEADRSQRALRDSERRYRQLVESLPAALYTCDAEGRLVFYNQAAVELWGREPVLGNEHWCGSYQLYMPDGTPIRHDECPMAVALREARALRGIEAIVGRPDGSKRHVLAHPQPILDETGRVVGALNILVDISDRKGMERALRENEEKYRALADRAEVANRAKDEFLAMLGHELRNPLAPISTALQLMRLRGSSQLGSEQEIIERQVQHLTRLVDDLLDVSRITRGKIDIKKQSHELAAVIARAVEMASPLLEQRRHHLSMAVPAMGLRVIVDEGRMAQVVSNLLTNAARYTDPGGEISIAAWQERDAIVLRVRDNGIGIAPDMLPRIFELFVQGERPVNRGDGGLGLGLTLVRTLVELHGGTVEAHSQGAGRGSDFIVRLPAAGPVEHHAQGQVAPGAPEPARKAARILVVDDNVDAASLLVELLALLGHEVQVAHDSAQALNVLADALPGASIDVGIFDIGLPVMDGYELARRVRRMPGLSGVKLFAVTGYGQESDRIKAAEAGFDHHLTKPLDMQRLLALLDQMAEAAGH